MELRQPARTVASRHGSRAARLSSIAEAVERQSKRLVTRLKLCSLRQCDRSKDLNTKAARGLDKHCSPSSRPATGSGGDTTSDHREKTGTGNPGSPARSATTLP